MRPEQRGAIVGIVLLFALMWAAAALGCWLTGEWPS